MSFGLSECEKTTHLDIAQESYRIAKQVLAVGCDILVRHVATLSSVKFGFLITGTPAISGMRRCQSNVDRLKSLELSLAAG